MAVTDGVIHYRILSPTSLRIEDARWPFSGGELSLEPALLDFADGGARRLTFRVKGMDAARFIQKFDFKNIDATGTFDGVLPMIFTSAGGRVEDGSLSVREGGGTIAYVGPVSQKELGLWGDMAFQALKSLRYTVEFFAPLYGRGAVKRYLKEIKALQDSLGRLNDIAHAQAVVSELAPAGAAAELRHAAGAVEGWYRASRPYLVRQALERWDAFKGQRRFWE